MITPRRRSIPEDRFLGCVLNFFMTRDIPGKRKAVQVAVNALWDMRSVIATENESLGPYYVIFHNVYGSDFSQYYIPMFHSVVCKTAEPEYSVEMPEWRAFRFRLVQYLAERSDRLPTITEILGLQKWPGMSPPELDARAAVLSSILQRQVTLGSPDRNYIAQLKRLLSTETAKSPETTDARASLHVPSHGPRQGFNPGRGKPGRMVIMSGSWTCDETTLWALGMPGRYITNGYQRPVNVLAIQPGTMATTVLPVPSSTPGPIAPDPSIPPFRTVDQPALVVTPQYLIVLKPDEGLAQYDRQTEHWDVMPEVRILANSRPLLLGDRIHWRK